MLKNILIALGVVVGFVFGFYVAERSPGELGGTVYNRQIDFSEGISIDGTEVISGTRNGDFDDLAVDDDLTVTGQMTAAQATGSAFGSGTASSISLLTVGNSITSTVVFGTSNRPVCFASPAWNAAKDSAADYRWYFFTTTGVEVSVTKPATCP